MLAAAAVVSAAGAIDRGPALAASAAGAVGLVAVHERLRAEFGPPAALIASLLFFAATSLFWFMISAPSPRLTGLFAVMAVAALLADRVMRGDWTRRWLAATGLAGTATLLALLTTAPPIPPAWIHWTDPLFASAQGLLAWQPLAYLAAVGLLVYARTNLAYALAALGSLAITAWLATARGAANHELSGSFLPVLALLAPGIACLVNAAARRPWLAVLPLVLAALTWNYWLMVQYTIGLLPKDAPVRFADMVRQQADVHTAPPYMYPFAFPMNALFAWIEGVPIDRYDLLAAEPLPAAADLALDRRSARFLLDGWDAPGADPAAPSWWIRDPRAELLLPISIEAFRPMRLAITARSRFEEPTVEALLGVEINGTEVGRFYAPADAPAEITIRLPGEAVGRILHAGYNRVAFVQHGVRRADPEDTRPPGPLAARTGGRAWPVAIYRLRLTPEPLR